MKSCLILLFFLSVCGFSSSQTTDTISFTHFPFPLVYGLDSHYIQKYPLVDFSKNQFQFYSDTNENWVHLYQQLDTMVQQKDRKLNFYHIGGSHLQADIYTHLVRTKLQTTWSELPGERGFIFPFNLAKTNNPSNYEISSSNEWKGYRSVSTNTCPIDYGLLGAVVSSTDSVIQLRFKYKKTAVKSPISHVRIFHNAYSFPFQIQLEGNQLVAEQITDTLQGITDIYLLDEVDSLAITIHRISDSIIPFYLSAIELLNDRPGISYTAIGINGAGLYTYLACGNFENQLRIAPADFFAFSVGTNDGNVPYSAFDPLRYKANLEKMILTVLRANPRCAILLTVPNDAYYMKQYPNKNIAREREVILQLAQQYQCAVWDMYGIMGELGASKKWHAAGLMQGDKVHFTGEGYQLKGELYFDAFLKFIAHFQQLGY